MSKLEMYKLAIIGRYELRNEMIKKNYQKCVLEQRPANTNDLMLLQKLDKWLENANELLQDYNKNINELEQELFANDVISVANKIINGGN